MGRITLITGGSRSGKSSFAQRTAESMPGPRAFIATCPVIDEEMEQRIRKHREARAGASWHTIEEPTDLARALEQASGHAVCLVDCLTLWINNLMYEAEKAGGEITEEQIADHCREVLATCRRIPADVILVTNEVGYGIVPDNPASRRYRDLVGRCNQVMAAGADTVTLVTCGIPLNIKQGSI